MRIFLIAVFFIFAFGFDVKIVEVQKDYAKIDNYVKKGISGYVICNYQDTPIICARAITYGNIVKFYPYENLKNDAFALPLVMPKVGDKIILGKDYDRILIIAPNQETYIKVKNMYKRFDVISSDVFAPFINDLPTKEDFRKFCDDFNIGRIIFVLDKIYEVDSFSFYKIYEKDFKTNAKYKKAFFTSYPSFDVTGENIEKYYKSLIKGL
jgi:hypothetical protein